MLPALARHPLRTLDLQVCPHPAPLAPAEMCVLAAALSEALLALRSSLRELTLGCQNPPVGGAAAVAPPTLPLCEGLETLRVSGPRLVFAPTSGRVLSLRVLSVVQRYADDGAAAWDWNALAAVAARAP